MAPSTTAQQLRASVQLIKPELLADVPSDYNRRQVFNYLRHKATNYDALLAQHREQYGDITPAENKALTQGAADVVIEALFQENKDLMHGSTNTIFANFARRLRDLLGLEPDIDLQAIYEGTKTLKRSQVMYRSWNERYRRQREMVLEVAKNADPEIYRQIESIYKANSKDKLDVLAEGIFSG